jgi:hypothetical protein
MGDKANIPVGIGEEYSIFMIGNVVVVKERKILILLRKHGKSLHVSCNIIYW